MRIHDTCTEVGCYTSSPVESGTDAAQEQLGSDVRVVDSVTVV